MIVRCYVESIGLDGERVETWSRRRVAFSRDDERWQPFAPPSSPPPGWADVGRPGQKYRGKRSRGDGWRG